MPKINYTIPVKERSGQGLGVNPEKVVEVRKDERINSRGSAKSQKSEKGVKEEAKGNIFRGLGYNIITNHKYSFDMVNSYKNSTSAWLSKQ